VRSTTTIARAAAGASGARHSLRPLIEEGGIFKIKLGHIRPRDRDGVFENTLLLARNDGKLEERVPSHGATPADQLSSALQTQNLDLNRSNFQSKHSPEVQSMD
jgi:hypothetical protein